MTQQGASPRLMSPLRSGERRRPIQRRGRLSRQRPRRLPQPRPSQAQMVLKPPLRSPIMMQPNSQQAWSHQHKSSKASNPRKHLETASFLPVNKLPFPQSVPQMTKRQPPTWTASTTSTTHTTLRRRVFQSATFAGPWKVVLCQRLCSNLKSRILHRRSRLNRPQRFLSKHRRHRRRIMHLWSILIIRHSRRRDSRHCERHRQLDHHRHNIRSRGSNHRG